jgi:hypothetical protein
MSAPMPDPRARLNASPLAKQAPFIKAPLPPLFSLQTLVVNRERYHSNRTHEARSTCELWLRPSAHCRHPIHIATTTVVLAVIRRTSSSSPGVPGAAASPSPFEADAQITGTLATPVSPAPPLSPPSDLKSMRQIRSLLKRYRSIWSIKSI